MTGVSDKIKAARAASDMSQTKAAQTACVSPMTYAKKEANPEKFTFEEVGKLYEGMNATGRELLKDAVSFFAL